MGSIIDDASKRINELEAQVLYLVDYMNELGMLEENCFTFPDGETVHATKVLDTRPTTVLKKEACGARKAQGWGGMSYCSFEKGHPPGRHSWSVT